MPRQTNLMLIWWGIGILGGSFVLAFLTTSLYFTPPEQNWTEFNISPHAAPSEILPYANKEKLTEFMERLKITLSESDLQQLLELFNSPEFQNADLAKRLKLLANFLKSLNLAIDLKVLEKFLVEYEIFIENLKFQNSPAQQKNSTTKTTFKRPLSQTEFLEFNTLVNNLFTELKISPRSDAAQKILALINSAEFQALDLPAKIQKLLDLLKKLGLAANNNVVKKFLQNLATLPKNPASNLAEQRPETGPTHGAAEKPPTSPVTFSKFSSNEPTNPRIGTQAPPGSTGNQHDPARLLQQIQSNPNTNNFTTSRGLTLNLTQPFSVMLQNADGSQNIWSFKSAKDPNLTLILEKHKNQDLTFNKATPATFAEKSRDLQIYDSIHGYADGSNSKSLLKEIKTEIQNCEAAGNCTTAQKRGASFLYALLGNFKAASDAATEAQMPSQTLVKIRGLVTTENNTPLHGAQISVLGKTLKTTTAEDGSYQLEFLTYDLAKIRLKATHDNYNSGVIALNVLGTHEHNFTEQNFTLNPKLASVKLNLAQGTASSSNPNKVSVTVNTDHDSVRYLLKTPVSEYQITPDQFFDASGKPFNGVVTAYLFEFDRDSDIQTILANDSFNEAVGYGTGLITYGMPLIAFFDSEGAVLHISKNKPLALTYEVPAKEEIKEYPSKIVTLQKLSNNHSDPFIDSKFLAEQEIDFPTFWIFDFTKGIWQEEPFRVNADSQIETIFYTKS